MQTPQGSKLGPFRPSIPVRIVPAWLVQWRGTGGFRQSPRMQPLTSRRFKMLGNEQGPFLFSLFSSGEKSTSPPRLGLLRLYRGASLSWEHQTRAERGNNTLTSLSSDAVCLGDDVRRYRGSDQSSPTFSLLSHAFVPSPA